MRVLPSVVHLAVKRGVDGAIAYTTDGIAQCTFSRRKEATVWAQATASTQDSWRAGCEISQSNAALSLGVNAVAPLQRISEVWQENLPAMI